MIVAVDCRYIVHCFKLLKPYAICVAAGIVDWLQCQRAHLLCMWRHR